MSDIAKYCKAFATLVLACGVVVSGVAVAQTWSTPQFMANGGGVAVATNGSTSAVLFIPPSGGLQASVKTGSSWTTRVTLTSLGSFGSGAGNIAVAPNGDVLAVWSFRTTNTYLPNEAQAVFFTAGHWGSPVMISANVYGNVNSFGLPGIGFDSSPTQRPDWKKQRRMVEELSSPKVLANLEFIEEIGGGLNCKRPQFTALVDSVVADELAMLVMAHQDRWARFGLELLPRLGRKPGWEWLALNPEKVSPEPEMVQDWMAITDGFSSRLSGLGNDRRAWKEGLQ